MNERIQELADQCYHQYSEYNIDLEKFAELIVRECADVALWQQGKGYDVSEMIKKHFGVEE